MIVAAVTGARRAVKRDAIVKPFLLAGLPLLCAAAAAPMGPSVAVMPSPNKPFEAFVQEDVLCRQYASNAVAGQAEQPNNQAAGRAANGTVLGAGLGAAVGTVHDANGGPGAEQSIQQQYDKAYSACMVSKGNQVAGYAPAGQPPAPLGTGWTEPALPEENTGVGVLAPLLGQFDCAGLNASLTGAGDIAIGGFVSRPEDRAAVLAQAGRLVPDYRIQDRIKVTSPPFCAAWQMADAAGNAQVTAIGADHADGRYRPGDLPVVTVTPPASIPRGWLMVDLVDADGSFWHLGAAPESGEPVTIRGDCGDCARILGGTLGPKLLLAIVGDRPLPQVKLGRRDAGVVYLPWLRQKLAEAEAAGAQVSLASLTVEVGAE